MLSEAAEAPVSLRKIRVTESAFEKLQKLRKLGDRLGELKVGLRQASPESESEGDKGNVVAGVCCFFVRRSF